ncbi:MAG: AEC family transporter [Epulopiscium sp.]|nr:AEC family transporter [Candidatus Epulonipiscium sp.]
MQIQFGEVISQLIIMVIIIMIGYGAKKWRLIGEVGEKDISRLVVNITSPALIISSLSISLDENVSKNIIMIAAITSGILVSSYLISLLILGFKSYEEEEKVIYHFSMVFGNVAFLGFPMCYALFGKEGLLYASVYSAVQDLFFWSLGVQILAKKGEKLNLKNLLNPCMIALVIGIFILIFKIPIPSTIEKALTSIGGATIPLALMLVGSSFFNYKISKGTLKQMIVPSFIKLLLVPLIGGLILLPIPIPELLKYIIIIELSMPCAASSVVLAKNYGRDHVLASTVVMHMTGFSLLTIPIVILIINSLW